MTPSSKKLSCICFAVCILFINQYSAAQTNVFKAKDGTKISVEILETNPDLGKNSSVYIGPIGIGGLKLLGIDHYQPTKYFISTMIGPRNFSMDGNYFFVNSTKEIKKPYALKGDSRVRYTAKIASTKRRSLGAHLNINHLNQLNFKELSSNYGAYKTTEISPGISWFTAKNLSLRIDNDKVLKGNSYFRINLDATIHSFQSINVAEYTSVSYRFTPSGKDTIVSTPAVGDVLNKVGYKFYIDGKSTSFGKGRFTYKYLIGIQSSPLKADGLKPRVIGGVGIGYSFNMKKEAKSSSWNNDIEVDE